MKSQLSPLSSQRPDGDDRNTTTNGSLTPDQSNGTSASSPSTHDVSASQPQLAGVMEQIRTLGSQTLLRSTLAILRAGDQSTIAGLLGVMRQNGDPEVNAQTIAAIQDYAENAIRNSPRLEQERVIVQEMMEQDRTRRLD